MNVLFRSRASLPKIREIWRLAAPRGTTDFKDLALLKGCRRRLYAKERARMPALLGRHQALGLVEIMANLVIARMSVSIHRGGRLRRTPHRSIVVAMGSRQTIFSSGLWIFRSTS